MSKLLCLECVVLLSKIKKGKKMTYELSTLLGLCEFLGNRTLFDSFLKTRTKIETKQKILCFISGGSDSDIMLDVLAKLDPHKKVKYIFFDTGIEYQATKKHLDFLEQKYGIKIERMKAG